MDLRGGGTVADTTLFGKYQLCRVLGRGRSGTVYLAKHKDLEEYRAIKQVPKTCVAYSQFRKEALILKSIRHPGIPIVYDLEEDESYSYLIEEYLEGDSLYTLISDMGHFSRAMTVRYGIQICHLVHILHSARPNPILYLDLQPKNLLLCHDVVKLIDFDHAVHLRDAEHLTLRYGTVGCAAPEQYTEDALDERTDIYAIGAVLFYMLTGCYPGENPGAFSGWKASEINIMDSVDRNLMRVIRRCLKTDKNKRYTSAEQLCRALEETEAFIQRKNRRKRRGIFSENPTSSLTIAVAGSRPGAGATHIAVGLTAYLRTCGISALYEEKNESGAAGKLADWAQAMPDKTGVCMIRGIPVRPKYGDCVLLREPDYPVRVWDLGNDWQKLLQESAEAFVLVCGAKPWERDASGEALSALAGVSGLALVFNHFCGRLVAKLPGTAGAEGYFRIGEDPDPFEPGKEAKQVYEGLLRLWGGRKGRRSLAYAGDYRSRKGRGRNPYCGVGGQLSDGSAPGKNGGFGVERPPGF